MHVIALVAVIIATTIVLSAFVSVRRSPSLVPVRVKRPRR